MKLVIVESPTKCKTIGHYLGDDFVVEASVGHIRDLAISGKGGFGVDVDNGFKPTYIVDADKKEVIKKLKDLQKNADE
ncbi:MAG: DNA topoisomerase I, partial [Bacilli bacterium]|nr:DNA topoisomerase I [Bacilli bacterium]